MSGSGQNVRGFAVAFVSIIAVAGGCSGCGARKTGLASESAATTVCTQRTTTDYEGQQTTYCAEDYPTDFQEGQNAPAASTARATPSEIESWLHAAARGKKWMHAFKGVRLVTDTALVYFDPFAGNAFGDFNALPENDLCVTLLDQGFSGVEHVKVVSVVGPTLLAECP